MTNPTFDTHYPADLPSTFDEITDTQYAAALPAASEMMTQTMAAVAQWEAEDAAR